MSLEEALEKAEEEGLDLVELAPEAVPPVCRLIDYNKYRYEQARKEKEAGKKQHVTHLKEVRMRPKIAEHDYLFKLHNAEKFLRARDKVKATMLFRGREKTHQELGRELLERFAKDLEEVGAVEQNPRFQFGRMTMVLAPK
jgi:translation initiation factor IF-3